MNTITINANELANLIIASVDKAGSTDWGIYTNIKTGVVDLRHNIYSSNGWVEVCNMYSGIDEDWLGVTDEGYDEENAISFLITDTIPEWLTREFEDNDGNVYNINVR